MSTLEFEATIDLYSLADALRDYGLLGVDEDNARDIAREEARDVLYDLNLSDVTYADDFVRGIVEDVLRDDNVDATLKEDLIDAQERIKSLETTLERIVDAIKPPQPEVITSTSTFGKVPLIDGRVPDNHPIA